MPSLRDCEKINVCQVVIKICLCSGCDQDFFVLRLWSRWRKRRRDLPSISPPMLLLTTRFHRHHHNDDHHDDDAGNCDDVDNDADVMMTMMRLRERRTMFRWIIRLLLKLTHPLCNMICHLIYDYFMIIYFDIKTGPEIQILTLTLQDITICH